MEQVVKFWNTVTNIGVEEGDSSIESVKVRLLNQIALIGFFTSVFFSIIYYIIQVDFPAVIAVCIGYTLELGVFYFAYKKRHYIGRFLFCWLLPLCVAFFVLLFGGNFGETNFFTIFTLVNFVMYDGIRKVQISAVILTCFLYMSSKLYVAYYPPLWERQTPLDDVITFPMVTIVLGLIIYLYQKSLKESEAEQVSLIEDLEYKNRELEEVNDELEDFTYIASHDLKTPLRTINGNIGLAKKHLKKGDYEAVMVDLDYVSQSAKQMYALVNDILEYKVLKNQEELAETIDLNEIITNILYSIKSLMIQKNAEVIACSLPKIVGRRYEFMALFQNLIENGIKYNESGNPRIIIKTKALKDEFVIAFHDNGIGIEAAYYEKIFKFFKRLHTQEQYQGTGIGLSLCKKIVRKYDGDITVSSEVGKGTTFRIILPKKHIAE